MVNEQMFDGVIGPVYTAVEAQKKRACEIWSGLCYESKMLLQYRLKIVDGMLTLRNNWTKSKIVNNF